MLLRRLITLSALLVTAGVVAVGCSDPADPPAQGAVSYRIANALNIDTTTESNCTISPAVEKSFGSANARSRSALVDGTTGSITCSVTQSGEGYAVAATMGDSDRNTFSISGTVIPGKTADKIKVSVSIPKESAVYASEECTVTMVIDDGQSYSASPGKVWGAVDCPKMEKIGDPQPIPICALRSATTTDHGAYFVFENCAKLAERSLAQANDSH
jgi:hypothetical protein